ncbi:MAG: ribonuclease HI family protein [Caldisericaceae bacterium]|nr:ribonuclease HI family protein [Caldisericaceae bacterium]
MIKIYTDGASRGNPGESAFAFIFTEKGKVIFLSAEYIGSATNNIAEYMAIISALREAGEKNIDRASLISDSELVISQINGTYKTKATHLKKLNEEVKELCAQFISIKFSNAPRTDKFIGIADKLCNAILDLA